MIDINNILPKDGTVIQQREYYLIPLFESLLRDTPWKHDEIVLFGKHITTKRQVAWYGDGEYTYSKTTKKPLPWTADLLEIKRIVERISGVEFNSCLLNLYMDGSEGIAWHSDDEKELGDVICSVSLGAKRRFLFKHKQTKEVVKVELDSGSVLVMKGYETQNNWLHSLPVSKIIAQPRINLTFRTIKNVE